MSPSGKDTQDGHAARELPWDRPVTRRDLLRYGGTLGFGVVGASMLASCSPVVENGASSGSAAPPDLPPAQAKYMCMVIVDGCRADYLEKGLHLPNLEAMTRNGTKYTSAWTGSMESITPACHACIGTGRFAKNNGGILGFYWENPSNGVYSEHVNLTNSIKQGQPGSEYAIDPTSLEEVLQRNKIPTMAGLLKDADPTAKVYAGAGAKFYAADAAGGPDADFITYIWNYGGNYYRGLNIGGTNHRPISEDLLTSIAKNDYTDSNYGNKTKHIPATPGESDSMVIDLARKVIELERPRIVMLNLGEQDFPYGHENGGILAPHWWEAVMTNVDAGLGRLMDTYRKLGIFEETVFIFLGDHGMVPLKQQVDKFEVFDAVQSAGAQLMEFTGGGHSADFHTGGFLWLTDPLQAAKVADFMDDAMMAGNLRGVLAVYFRGQYAGRQQFLPSPNTSRTLLPATDRAYRYLLETLNGPTAPQVILLYEELTGTIDAGGLTPTGKQNQWHGDHGGASWSSHWIPLIMSGAGIRKGHISRFPARLVNLTPTTLRLMGAPYPELDGIVLADALASAAASERSAQRVMATQLIPVVSAMKRQANIDMQNIQANGPKNPPVGNPGLQTASGQNTVY